jgi:hypothetical protein
MELFPDSTGALLSPCRRYRYLLWRIWDPALPVLTYLMLNPATADEVDNDPTITRCQKRAQLLGMGGMRVANLFAWRSAYPEDLAHQVDPVGPDNDRVIVQACQDSEYVICGWGKHGGFQSRDRAVIDILKAAKVDVRALRINADGSPGHPLYISYEVLPTAFELA